MVQRHGEGRALLQVTDAQVEAWLEGAKLGQAEEREKLARWAYWTAYEYYQGKLGIEQALTVQDAHDLAAGFIEEFQRRLLGIQTVTHYTRTVLKNRLTHHLARKRQRLDRVVTRTMEELECLPDAERADSDRPWEAWDDETWDQYRITLQMLGETDETTRSIISSRMQEVPYSVIAEQINLSEAAIRMRVSRFYKAVRERFAQYGRKR